MAEKHKFVMLDGLRGIAAIAVVLFHRRWWFADDGGFLQHAPLAVDFFFLLSGFVIAYAYEPKLIAGMSLRRFLIKRLIRLYPLIILGAFLGGAFILLKEIRNEGRIADTIEITLFGIAAIPMPFPNSIANQPFYADQPLWSIFFELLVNIGFAAFLYRLTNSSLKLIVVFTAVVYLIAVAVKGDFGLIGNQYGPYGWMLLAGLPRTACSFFLGVIIFRRLGDSWISRVRAPAWTLPVILIAIFAVPDLGNIGNTIMAALSVLIVFPLIVITGANAQLDGVGAKIAAISGAVSFPIYVLHEPMYAWSDPLMYRLGLFDQVVPSVLACALVFGIAVFSLIVYKIYDIPIRRFLTSTFDTSKQATTALRWESA
ncbi:acyltransferase [Mesorhizobium sp. ESP7-2]|uniref:acyltransferase family protein n=1 Tax=Mesorhizobium sp. ESP7-2 TaxID=2876622 RepID=UPI001CCFF360|nr:acyltransferase [Mesorhizobium sp. ESP7-2]MBZ9710942.1 acyltransferase [Mesorhizobium sp. ESP7-2]